MYKLKIDQNQILRLLERLSPKRSAQAIQKGMREGIEVWRSHVVMNKISGVSPSRNAGKKSAGSGANFFGNMSGQVLGVVTGRLRKSIFGRVRVEGDKILGEVGTNVKYGAAHEYGFKGLVFKTSSNGVRFVSRMNLPERSFVRSALQDKQADIVEAVRKNIMQAIGET